MSRWRHCLARPRDRGQALVEFALIVPLFFVLALAVVDGARLVAANNSVAQAAREAARLAAVQAPYIGASGADCTAPVCPASTEAFSANVLEAANRMTAVIGSIPASGVHIACTGLGSAPSGDWTGGNVCAGAGESGEVVSVRVAVPIEPLTPVFDAVFPTALSASSTMVIP